MGDFQLLQPKQIRTLVSKNADIYTIFSKSTQNTLNQADYVNGLCWKNYIFTVAT